jgi:hypothetical protein
MSSLGYARALYDFTAQHQEDVSLSAGDVVQVLEEVDSNWLKGRNHNKVGYFPYSYIGPLDLPNIASNHRLFLAVKPFAGDEEGDLSFNEGDIIIGLQCIDINWWHGCVSGHCGIFPLTHVVQLDSSGSCCNVWRPSTNKQPVNKSSQQLVAVGSSVRAIRDLVAQLDDELPLNRGDVVTILHDLGDGFAIGECNGHVGQFPMSFVEYHATSESNKLPNVTLTESSCKKSHARKSSYTLANTRSHESSVRPYCSTVHSFNGKDGQLSFSVGQIVHLISHVDDDWCYGELDGCFGVFPTSYVDIIVDCTAEMSQVLDNKCAINTAEMYGRVLHDFTAGHEQEIDVREGDTVTVLKHCAPDWLQVRHDNGTIGLCPSFCVELFTASPTPTSPSPVHSVKPKPPVKPKSLLQSIGVQDQNSDRQKTKSQASSTGTSLTSATANLPSPAGSKQTPVATPRTSVGTFKQHSSQASLDEMILAEFSLAKSNSADCQQPVQYSSGSVSAGWQSQSTPPLHQLSQSPLPLTGATKRLPLTPRAPLPTAVTAIPNSSSESSLEHLVASSSELKTTLSTPKAKTKSDLIDFSPDSGISQGGPVDCDMQETKCRRRETRENVVLELITTETDYCSCLQLCIDTFYTSHRTASHLLLPDEMEMLFSKLNDVIYISQKLTKRLEADVKLKPFSDQIVGLCFIDLKDEIQKIYAIYCRNHDNVISILEKYESNEEVMDYINERLTVMRRQSTVFDLGSVLIKPVQRILKYPLLLSELVKVTEDDHVDKPHLLTAVAAMTDVAATINEYKRRKDLVLKYKKDAKLTDRISRLSVHSTKKKLKRISQMMAGVQTVDENFVMEEQKFKCLDAVVRIMARDVSQFLEQLEESVSSCEQISIDVHDFYDEESSQVGDLCVAYSNITASLFTKFKADVERYVVPPLNSLLLMFQGPMNVIRKRYDKLLDYENASKRLELGNTTNEELVKCKADYEAINAQLLEDLPRLFLLSIDISTDVLHHFLRLQQDLHSRVVNRLSSCVEHQATSGLVGKLPSSIMETFNIAHTTAVEHMSTLSLIPAAFNPHLDELRRSQQSPAGIQPPTTGAGTVYLSQNQSHQTYLLNKFSENNLYIVSENVCGSQLMDLSLAKGTLVGVIKQGDPMGNRGRWYIDCGVAKGFVCQQFLSPRQKCIIEEPRDLLSWSMPLTPDEHNSCELLQLLDPLASSASSQCDVFNNSLDCPSQALTHSQLLLHNDIAPAVSQRGSSAHWEQFTDDKPMSNHRTSISSVWPASTAKYRVLYTFIGRDSSEVSVNEGDIVQVLQQADLDGNAEWWLIARSDGKRGYVPANYLTDFSH